MLKTDYMNLQCSGGSYLGPARGHWSRGTLGEAIQLVSLPQNTAQYQIVIVLHMSSNDSTIATVCSRVQWGVCHSIEPITLYSATKRISGCYYYCIVSSSIAMILQLLQLMLATILAIQLATCMLSHIVILSIGRRGGGKCLI